MTDQSNEPPEHPRAEQLSGRLQLGGFAVCIVLAGLFAVAASYLVQLATAQPEACNEAVGTVLRWALVGGFVGGAGRSLFRFIWEVGGCAEHKPSHYINKWFLYLVKPAMGSAGGLFFFLAVNLGLVGLLTDEPPTCDFYRVCLTSVLGGIFFEDVFALLAEIIPRPKSNQKESSSHQ